MLELGTNSISTILCIGAHADDIEIGCGGTLLKLLAEYPGIEVTWLVLSAGGSREKETRDASDRFLKQAGKRQLNVFEFPDAFLFEHRADVKRVFGELRRELSPDLVFTHGMSDRHQDHALAAELTWNTFRDHLILEYEIPKYEGDLTTPNMYVPLAREHCDEKCRILSDCFVSQTSKPWFSPETFKGLMRIRGIECNAPEGYAEAFHVRKQVL